MDPMHATATEDGGAPVVLRIYDLSRGMAANFSQALIGKKIDGIWHTGVYVFGKEYYFGGGIQSDPVSYVEARVGKPIQTLLLGYTYIPKQMFHEYLHEVSPQYTAQTYNLFTHNCNNFSSEVARFLTGNDIPEYILNLPQEALNTPIGAMIRNMMEGFQSSMQHSGFIPGFNSPTQSPITSHPTRETQQNAIASDIPSVDVTPATDEKPSTNSSPDTASSPPPTSPKSAWAEAEASNPPQRTPTTIAGDQQRRQEILRAQRLSPLLSDQGSLAPIANKIITISSTLDENLRLSSKDQDILLTYAQGKTSALITYPILDRILKTWTVAHLMSVLFLTKMVVLDEACLQFYMDEHNGLIEKTLELLCAQSASPKHVQIMAMCVITNAVSKKSIFPLLKSHNRSSNIVDVALRGIYSNDLNIRMTSSALLQNTIIFLVENDETDFLTQVVCSLVDRICIESDKIISIRAFEQMCFIASQKQALLQLVDDLEPSFPDVILKSESTSIKLLAETLLQRK